jgi:hypothetical protein
VCGLDQQTASSQLPGLSCIAGVKMRNGKGKARKQLDETGERWC